MPRRKGLLSACPKGSTQRRKEQSALKKKAAEPHETVSFDLRTSLYVDVYSNPSVWSEAKLCTVYDLFKIWF